MNIIAHGIASLKVPNVRAVESCEALIKFLTCPQDFHIFLLTICHFLLSKPGSIAIKMAALAAF